MSNGYFRPAAPWLGSLMGLLLLPLMGCSSPTPAPPATAAVATEPATAAPATPVPVSTSTPDATQTAELAMRLAEASLVAIEERQQALAMRVPRFESETVAANRETELQAILDDLDVTARQAAVVLDQLDQAGAAATPEHRQRVQTVLDNTTEIAERLTAPDGPQNEGLTALVVQLQALRERAASASPAP